MSTARSAPFVAALRPSEIDAARQFADADEVGAPHHLGLERRAVGQRVEERDGAQVGEQSSDLRMRSSPCSGRTRRFGVVVVFGVADGAEQHGVGFAADFVRLLRVGIPVASMAQAPTSASR